MNLCDDFLAHMEAEDQRAEPTSVVAWGILNSTARLYRVHTRTAPPVAQLPPLPTYRRSDANGFAALGPVAHVTGGPSSYLTLVWWYPIYMGILYCNVPLHRSFPFFTAKLS
jgi:hypothetical protein